MKRFAIILFLIPVVALAQMQLFSGNRNIHTIPRVTGGGGGSGVTTNLIVWNKGNDGSGTELADSSGNNNNKGYWNGTPSWGADFITTSKNNYVTNAHNVGFNVGTGNYAVSIWFKTSLTDSNAMILDIGSEGDGIALIPQFDGRFVFASRTASSAYTEPVLNDNNWHMVGMSRNGTAVRCFVDGTNAVNFTSSDDIPQFPTTSRITLGMRGDGALFFPGSLSDFRFFTNYVSDGGFAAMFAAGRNNP